MDENYMPFKAPDNESLEHLTEEAVQNASASQAEPISAPVTSPEQPQAAASVAPEGASEPSARPAAAAYNPQNQQSQQNPQNVPPQFYRPAATYYSQQPYGYRPPVQQAPQQGAPVPPRPVNPGQGSVPPYQAGGQHMTAKQPKPKKKRPGLRIAAIALSCALLGSVCGGAIVGVAMRSGEKDNTSYTAKTATEAITANTSPRPEISNVSNTDGTMTPAQVYQANVAAVVGIANESTTYNVFGQASTSASSGSGFIISSDGEILTNYHVVKGAQTLTVTLHDNTKYDAVVLGYEEDSDVALLKIDATDLPTVTLGDSSQLYVGDEVAAIGNPLGELTYSLTVGYISSMDRDVNTDGVPINMMQIDAAINPGNSGGPLFDMYGNVIGINTAKYSGTLSGSGATIEGIGFAIPINDVVSILDDLRETGTVPDRAYIGVTVTTVAESSAMQTPGGVMVNSVTSGSSGDKAGLKANDIITAIDDTPITDTNALSKYLRKLRAGDSAVITVFRDGQTLSLSITFDAKPDSSETSSEATQPTETEEDDSGFGFFNPWSMLP